MSKHYITIEDGLYDDISAYCKMNGLKINEYCCELLKNEHNMSKYGDIPFGIFSDGKVTENLPLTNVETAEESTPEADIQPNVTETKVIEVKQEPVIIERQNRKRRL